MGNIRLTVAGTSKQYPVLDSIQQAGAQVPIHGLDAKGLPTKNIIGFKAGPPTGRYSSYGFMRKPLPEANRPIKTGTGRIYGRTFAAFREIGADGFPLGLGYKKGPAEEVAGGIWDAEVRCEIPGVVCPPLTMGATSLAWSGNAARVSSVGSSLDRAGAISSPLGNTSGKNRVIGFLGTTLWISTSDSDGTPVDTTWTAPSFNGTGHIWCIAPVKLNGLDYVAFGIGEIAHAGSGATNPTALRLTTDPTASPPSTVYMGNDRHDATANYCDILTCYWIVSIPGLGRTYAHIYGGTLGGLGYNSTGWGAAGDIPLAQHLVYWGFGDALTTAPTFVNSGILHATDQLAGVIGNRLYILTPLTDSPTAASTKQLWFFDTSDNSINVCKTDLDTITLACEWTHPVLGAGIVYSNGKLVHFYRHTDDRNYDFGFLRRDGRPLPVTIISFDPKPDRFGVTWQDDTGTYGKKEYYLPYQNRQQAPNTILQSDFFGAWYPWSIKFGLPQMTILPGGTPFGTVASYNAVTKTQIHCWQIPDNSHAKPNYMTEYLYHSNPMIDSVGVDAADSGGSGNLDTPLYDDWGGPEEQGSLLGCFIEGDVLSSSPADKAQVYYTTDLSSYTDLSGSITAANTETILATPVAIRKVGFRVHVERGATTTHFPNAAPVTAYGIKEPRTRIVHGPFLLDLAQMDTARMNTLEAELRAARDSSTTVKLEYGDFSGWVYVDDFEVKGNAAAPSVNGHNVILEASMSFLEVRPGN